MDESDIEAFDNFLEKHWPNAYKKFNYDLDKTEETVSTPKRRGRKPKTQV